MPFFSIIIPTYNRAHMLSKALESVHVQTFNDWECIVVDDGSTDNTKELLQQWIKKDNRFRYIYQENAERSAARNNGINNAKGDYICFLDSDDYFNETRLEKLYIAINNSKIKNALFFTDISFNNNGLLQTIVQDHYCTFTESLSNKADTLASVVIGVPQVCITAEIIMKNLFTPNISIGEDFECWLRISENNYILYIPHQSTIIASEHDDRSVNLKNNNSPKQQRKTLRYCFKKNHPGHKIDERLKRKLLADSYFNSAKHFMFNRKFAKAFSNIFRSIWHNPSNLQLKHRIFCLFNLLIRNIPNQYKF
ncbi:MAG: glycosyltransferase family 2 protein [Bacteroidales bacterium]|nr:glycosyltransferase family 2 protein [Bacteroidales bacterium]